MIGHATFEGRTFKMANIPFWKWAAVIFRYHTAIDGARFIFRRAVDGHVIQSQEIM